MYVKRLLLFLPLLLFFLPIVIAYEFNFTTPIELVSTNTSDRIKGFYIGTNEKWYLTYSTNETGAVSNAKVLQLSDEWIVEDTVSESCVDSNQFDDLDCNLHYPYIDCIGIRDKNMELFRYNITDNSSYQLAYYTYGAGTSESLPAISNDIVFSYPLNMWKRGTETSPRYTTTNNIGTDFVGDGTFTLPSVYQTFDDLQVAYCNGNYHVILYRDSVDQLVSLSYDINRNYLGEAYSFKPTGFDITKDNFGVSVNNNDNELYIAITNRTSEIPKINLQAWSCLSNGKLTSIFSETYNQTEIETTANITDNKFMLKPYLMKNDLGIFHLFYLWENNFDDDIKMTYNYECICSDWINTSICSYEKIKQVRTCYNNCSDSEQYLDNDYCARQINISLGIFEQNYKPYSTPSSCDSDWVETVKEPLTICNTKINIPFDCVNSSIKNTLNLYVDYSDRILKTNKNYFTTQICSPLNPLDCYINSSFYCQDASNNNMTYNKTVTNFNSGDIITSRFVVEGADCGVAIKEILPFGLLSIRPDGWYKHRINGISVLNCQKPCGGFSCATEGVIEYSIQEFIDCSVNDTSKVPCDYGCNQETGLCNPSPTSPTEPTSNLNLQNILNSLLNPSQNTKTILGLSGSFMLGILGLYLVGNSQNNGLIFTVGFALGFIGFSIFGWIPIVYTIVIVFMVGSYMLLKNIK